MYLALTYLVMPAFAFRADLWQGFTCVERTLLYLYATLSPPFLFALERGNLIVLTLPFLASALAEKGWKRAAAIGVLINIKPYFAIFLLVFALTRHLNEFTTSALAAGFIFLVSGIVLDLNFFTFFENLLRFSQDSVFSGRELLSMPSSISGFAQVLRTYYWQGGAYLFGNIDPLILADTIDLVKWAACAAILLCAGLAWQNLSLEKGMAVSVVLITNLGVWVGGYSMILYIVIVPFLFQMRFQSIYLVLILLILSPMDALTLTAENIGLQLSYLSGSQLNITWHLGIGSVFRPLLNFGLLLTLTFELFSAYMRLPDALKSVA
jgi:hypothetical protein